MRHLLLLFLLVLSFTLSSQTQITATVQPTPAQQAWMDMQFGMFISYGINTYYDKEWSDGTLDPKAFNPKALNTDEWCAAAKAAGMKYVIITTKHHDGFCLWPSKYTKYTVKYTPYKKDVLRQLVKSANKYDLKVGFYYSLWDRNNKLHDTDEAAYFEFMKKQLHELLTNYGPVCQIWFDGFWKKQKTGWEKPITDQTGEKVEGGQQSLERDLKFIQAWRNEGAYRWQMDHLYQYIKQLQPNCVVLNNSTTAYPGVPLHPVDIRSGEKYHDYNPNDKKVWNWLGKDVYLPFEIITTLSVRGNEQFPSGNWFWHANDSSVATVEDIRHLLDVSRKMDANFLLNVGIMDNGKLRPQDENVLRKIKQ